MRFHVPYAIEVALNGSHFVIGVGSCSEEVHVAVAARSDMHTSNTSILVRDSTRSCNYGDFRRNPIFIRWSDSKLESG